MAQTYGRGPSRIPFELKDPRGFAEFSRQLAEHDAQGSAHMSRGFQGARPSLYDFEIDIRKLATPALIVVGDEDERCIEPGLFLKDAISASGLVIFPKTGHLVNLEEPWPAISCPASMPAAGRRAIRAAVRRNDQRDGTGRRCRSLMGRKPRRGAFYAEMGRVFLVIAIIAGIFGFTDVQAASATIAQWLFGIFLVLFRALIIGLTVGAKLTS